MHAYVEVCASVRSSVHPFVCIHLMTDCFGFNGPLRQYFSLYRTASQRGRKKRRKTDKGKHVKTTPPAHTASAIGPCPTINEISRMHATELYVYSAPSHHPITPLYAPMNGLC